MPRAASGAERIALRVLQLGAAAVVLAAATYKVFELDRFFVPKELALHLAAFLGGLFVIGSVRRGFATRVDVLLVGYLLLSAVSAVFATNHWMAMRALGVSLSGVGVFWAARGVRQAGLARPLLVALGFAVVLAAATSLMQTYGVRTDFFSLNRAPGGTLGNRNFVAHVAAFGLPVLLLCGLRAYRPGGYLAGMLGVAAVAAVLFLTRSRAAWLALIAVGFVLLFGLPWVRPLRRSGRILTRFFALLLIGGGVGVAAGLLIPNTLNWKSDNPYMETAKGVVNYQEGSGKGRLIQYKNSLRMAMEHPLLGVGPGNWSVQYPDYARRRDPSMSQTEEGVTSNPWPSSDWVAFLSERGFPAFVLLILAFVGITVGAWRRMRAARDADEGLVALALAATLVGAVIVGAFDAVLLLPLPALWIWAALGVMLDPADLRPLAVATPVRVGALVLVALAAAASAARSTAQVVAMGLYATSSRAADLRLASQLDPGSYRIHLRLAQSGTRKARCEHATAAHELYPNAGQAAQLARRCTRRSRRR